MACNIECSLLSQKVEDASVKATDAAFGVAPSGKERGRAAAQVRSRQVRDQEETYAEGKFQIIESTSGRLHKQQYGNLNVQEIF